MDTAKPADEKIAEKLRGMPTKICLTCHRKFVGDIDWCPKDQTVLTVPDPDPLFRTPLAGTYEVLDVIGSGGWSLVYKARQRALGRPVAIKILHAHLVLDPDKVARFHREAEATSRFNHPVIPPVYDFGVLPSGQPYMVMGFVDGRSLAESIAENGALPVDKCVDIFIQCASGLSVAHARGIVHRDIKPGNILLTKDKHEVKILDFGLAKMSPLAEEGVSAHTTLTQAGHTIGTPAYMSPEQCLGLKLDARSDIYSLGCVMYESLTAIRPFEGQDAFDSMNMHMRADVSFENVKAKEPIPEALELCILKALAKNPIDRYQSADELQEALKAVQGNSYRSHFAPELMRWIHSVRRRLASESVSIGYTAASLTVSGLIALVCVASAWYWIGASHKPDPPPVTVGNAAELYRQYMAKADAALDSDNTVQAISSLTQALAQAQNFGPLDPRLMSTMQKLQSAYEKAGQSDEAKQISDQIQKVKNNNFSAMYGTAKGNAEKITKLSARMLNDPTNTKVSEELVKTLNDQAQLSLTESDYKSAREVLQQALDLEKNLLGTNNLEYARSLSNMAFVCWQTDELAKAEALYRQSLELRRKALGDKHPLVGKSLRNLGDFYLDQNECEKAEDLMKKSVDIFSKCGDGERSNYAWSLNNLGLVYARRQQFPQAQDALYQALAIRKTLYGKDGLDVGRTTNNIAQLDQAMRKYDKAEKEYWNALRIYDRQLGADNEDTIKCVHNLALMYFETGNLAEAEPLFKRVMNVLERQQSKDPKLESAYQHLASIYQHQGRGDDFKAVEQRRLKRA